MEAAELAGINRASLDKLKAFISRTNDGSVRLAYARRPESMPRRSIIVGSVDRSDCLPNDSAGNTRFVVVTLPRSCHVEPALDAVREQLWAEAQHRYQKGERANLPRELKPAAAVIAEVHRHADVITEDAIAAAKLTSSDGYKLADIAERTGTVGGSQRVLTTALKNVGFAERRVRVDGKQSRYWFPPPGNLPGFGEGRIGWLLARLPVTPVTPRTPNPYVPTFYRNRPYREWLSHGVTVSHPRRRCGTPHQHPDTLNPGTGAPVGRPGLQLSSGRSAPPPPMAPTPAARTADGVEVEARANKHVHA